MTVGATALMCFYSMHSSYVSSLAYSSPSIVIEAGRTQGGARVLYDDYREAYYWLRHNTDPNARIMSWWDYGYQVHRARALAVDGVWLMSIRACDLSCLNSTIVVRFLR